MQAFDPHECPQDRGGRQVVLRHGSVGGSQPSLTPLCVSPGLELLSMANDTLLPNSSTPDMQPTA